MNSTELGGKEKEEKENPWKKWLLYGALAGSVTGSVFWLVAMSTNFWVVWIFPSDEGLYRPQSKSFLLGQYAGMWQICRQERNNVSTSHYCAGMNFFPSAEQIERDPETDRAVLNYRRAVTAVAVIGLLATMISIAFTWYSIQQPRYMFKRLSGCLLIGSAACFIVCIEIYQGMTKYEKANLPARYPAKASHRVGFSFGLAWFCFVVYVASAVIVFVFSRKKKDKCDHDRPVIIGRI